MQKTSRVRCIRLKNKYVETWPHTKEFKKTERITSGLEGFLTIVLLFLPIQLIFLLIILFIL